MINQLSQKTDHPLSKANPPAWAAAWGHDCFGPWVEFEVGPATQRMRWIPPGRFLMGSPETEEGRFEDEGPQHEVVLTDGFWLFDTPCTQAMWQAVMGANPSEFQDPKRPVEQVSHEDVQEFIRCINRQILGLQLTLPTEAQWEYACRAGTTTDTYAGDLEVIGRNNAPILDAIAWYGGNSGHMYDLKSGYDVSRWSEKQYDGIEAGTRKVGLKLPNNWGLYDTLGNVSEWCLDGKRMYEKDAIVDPIGPITVGSERTSRGERWSSEARDVRADKRRADQPKYRNFFLGFRCSSWEEWRVLSGEGRAKEASRE